MAEILELNTRGSNVYLLKGTGGYILIDTGMKGTAKKLSQKLEELGSVPADIKMIVLTHTHYDHIEGLDEVRKLTGAPVVLHEGELKEIDLLSFKRNESSFVFRLIVKVFGGLTPKEDQNDINPEIQLKGDMDLAEFGFDANIIHTPGHSPGSVCVVTSDGQCICGDTLFDIFPGTHYPIIVYNREVLADTFRKLEEYNPSVYYPGHGKPITREKFKSRVMSRPKYFKSGN
jgi:glyoxylase-like metal-dependent hydrolase (beta-lactamase superfamily II)